MKEEIPRDSHNPPDYCETKSGQWVKAVKEIIRQMEFGEVHLTIHKGKVVELRKLEKYRFEHSDSSHPILQPKPGKSGPPSFS